MRKERFLLPLAGLVIVVLGLDLFQVRLADAASTRPGPTHLGVPAADIVTIRASGDVGGASILTIDSQGNTTDHGSSFVVPANRVLIITDVEWFGLGASGNAAGMDLRIGSSSGINVLILRGNFDPNGEISRAAQMTTGMPIASSLLVVFSGGASNIAHIRGYLTDAP